MKNFCIALLLLFPLFVKGQDSLITHVDMDRVFLKHRVRENETLYSITKRYMCELTSLLNANPSLKETYISAGDEIIIPFNTGIAPGDTLPVLKQKFQPIYHILQPRESLASLKRMYGFSMATFRYWNELKHDTLSIGQRMIVNWVNKDDNRNIVQQSLPTPNNTTQIDEVAKPEFVYEKPKVETKPNSSASLREQYQYQKNQGVVVSNNGFGKWFDSDDSPADLCLHKDLPKGTIIKLTNRMNDRVKYLKVISNLPPSGENAGIIVRISKRTAQELDILDKKFMCTVEYVVQ